HARAGFTDLGPLPLVPQWPTLHPAVLDALCAVGAVTAEATEIRWPALDRWARNPHGNLDALAAHPTLGLRAMTSLAAREVTDLTKHLDVLLTYSGTRTMLTRWLEYLAERRRQRAGALPDLGHDLEKKLPHLADPRLAELAPEALRTLFTVNPVASFTAAVRAGLLVEYAWPTLENSVDRLREETGEEAQVFSTFPQVAVLAGDRIEILDGPRVTKTLTAPTAGKDVRQVLTVGDSVLVLFRDGYDGYLWWEGDTAATPTDSTVTVGGAGTLPCTGGRLVCDMVLADHGRIPEDRWATVIAVPGTGTFTVNDSGKNLQRWDPASGTGEDAVTVTSAVEILEATGLSGLLAQVLPTGADPRDLWRRINWENVYALPVPETASVDNPLGAVDGTLVRVYGDAAGTQVWNAHRQVTPLGRFEDAGRIITGTAGEVWRLGYGARRTTDGAALSCSSDAAGRRHVLERLPELAWCFAGYRDRGASARMRGYTTELATEVIDTLVQDPERKVPVPDHYNLTRETTTTVNSTLEAPAIGVLAGQLGIDRGAGADLTLPVALSHLAADCAALAATADALRAQVFPDEADGQDAAPTVTTALTDEVVGWLSPWPLRADTVMWTSATNDLLTWAGADHPTGVTFEPYGAHRSVAHLAGRERMLLSHWASPLIPRETVPTLVALAREMVDAGLWCGPWTSATVELTPELADEFPEQELTWHDAGAPVLSLHGARFQPGYNDNRITVLVRRADLSDLTVPVIGGPPEDALGMDKAEFLTGLDALDVASTDAPDPVIDGDAVTRMRKNTGLSTPAVRMLLGGFRDPRYLDATDRTNYGLTAKQADLAGEQVFSLGQGTVEAVVAGAREVPEPTVRLTDGEWEQAAARSVGNYCTAAQALTGLLYRGETTDPAGATAALLALVAGMSLSDERRPAVADLLRTVNTAAAEYMAEPRHRTRLGEMDLGTSVEDKGFRGNVTPEDQAVRVGVEGLLDDLITDLDTVHPDLPGCPLDPRNCVPDLVSEVAATLHLSESAAAYYLQLLALADPTDAHIRAWNSWKKKDIDFAAGELVTAGLVVEAKRTGAGRTRFLPGGWLQGRTGITASRPMDVWTAPMYLMWADVKARP
ncbi:hypothetical protein, partial [uncultured Corynebacterium sp.]|uniref:hypothetical protein n=1 Tax=uncultured Corynebacterium sp. TaxID=159447 RepID=UPI0025CDD79E